MNLFIIGNGFDLAHEFPTRYCCFRCWLSGRISHYWEEHRRYISYTPETIMDNHGNKVVANNAETESFLLQILDECAGRNWCEFESGLYDVDLQSAFEEDTFFASDCATDKDGILRDDWLEELQDSSIEKLRINVGHIKDVFNLWIRNIQITNKPHDSIKQLMTNNDLYLSFNYTETLERLYNILPNCIYHIHGLRWSEYTIKNISSYTHNELENLIIGHGEEKPKEFIGMPEVVADEAIKIIEDLRKPTEQIIEKYEELWNKLSAVDSVYGYGFSYNKADLPYVEKICHMLDESVVWHLHTHDDVQNKEYEKSIKRCGFKGKFGRFSA